MGLGQWHFRKPTKALINLSQNSTAKVARVYSQISTSRKGPPMQLNFLPDQNYDCVRCGYGCRHDWNVHVDQQRVESIRANYTPIKAIEAVQPAFIDNDGDITLARTPDKHCVFLEGSANCGIHATLGMDAKPRDCQHYPLSMVDTPDGIQVGITYSCTAALRNVGSPISTQADSVTNWLREFQPTKLGYEPSRRF